MMKIVVWVVSGLLALFFLTAGADKVFASDADLEAMANGIPELMLRASGVAEIAGALGLVVPAATRILPVLTPVAAAGLTLTMVLATIANLVAGAYVVIAQTLILGAVSALVAWARFGPYSIQPRGTGLDRVTASANAGRTA